MNIGGSPGYTDNNIPKIPTENFIKTFIEEKPIIAALICSAITIIVILSAFAIYEIIKQSKDNFHSNR